MNPLSELKLLLENLPASLSEPLSAFESEYRELVEFELFPAVLERNNGDEAAAVGDMLWSIFIADGELHINERGQAILAVVDVLSHYLKKFPEDPTLEGWVARLIHAAKAVYVEHGHPVSALILPMGK